MCNKNEIETDWCEKFVVTLERIDLVQIKNNEF